MTLSTHVPSIQLNDGVAIPQFGLGVFQVPAPDTADLVVTAIEMGYRHIDTARIYRNEAETGEGMRRSGVPREELFVTTKLWNDDQGYDSALREFERSSELLDVDVIDLYLIHWPSPTRGLYVDSWRALVELQRQGRVRSIGVSNFHPEHLERIIDDTGVVPSVNQIELHPYLQQRELQETHARLGIRTEAWSPLGQGGELLDDPTLVAIARAHECTPAQVALAWSMAEGNVVFPKSMHRARLAENLQSVSIELSDAELEQIRALDRDDAGRVGPDPRTASF